LNFVDILCPKALRHFMTSLTVFDRLLPFTLFVNIKDLVAGITSNQHHYA